MNQKEFINVLDRIARELGRYACARIPGQEIWDGRRFVTVTERKELNLAALVWSQKIVAISTMLQFQDCPASVKQLEYLKKLLFGGMMSFSDLFFDENQLGPYACGLNERLDELREELALALRDE
jgi:hypothetical protein